MISPLSVIQIIADRDAQIAQLVEQRTEKSSCRWFDSDFGHCAGVVQW